MIFFVQPSRWKNNGKEHFHQVPVFFYQGVVMLWLHQLLQGLKSADQIAVQHLRSGFAISQDLLERSDQRPERKPAVKHCIV